MGNNRVIASYSGSLVQSNHYYPFGMLFAEGSVTSQQPYKYNGKELDTERGLNLYDYSARLMDSVLGWFSTVDSKLEKYYFISLYVYCKGNPLRFIDSDEREIQDPPSKGYWNWSREKYIKVAKYTKKQILLPIIHLKEPTSVLQAQYGQQELVEV
ncbi:MAG: RHS repeat domain-containing protein [Bacteroides graminisolvens]|uniref:RHS repeat domain-containing protein n=1 Tax=Bacteroides graminisolvens TaxID=477666 RepID=UPI003A8BD9BE